eukprot:TRINITY_DN264_c1_g4_i1.p1 TRINITY_DN264_c1_g4~~TRINITY_DN264_c1_g4_i1.p1  ORF type:complete len:327 (+),score=66.18 TRINITY_DN264_c1_g4_i1:168-1148(+)
MMAASRSQLSFLLLVVTLIVATCGPSITLAQNQGFEGLCNPDTTYSFTPSFPTSYLSPVTAYTLNIDLYTNTVTLGFSPYDGRDFSPCNTYSFQANAIPEWSSNKQSLMVNWTSPYDMKLKDTVSNNCNGQTPELKSYDVSATLYFVGQDCNTILVQANMHSLDTQGKIFINTNVSPIPSNNNGWSSSSYGGNFILPIPFVILIAVIIGLGLLFVLGMVFCCVHSRKNARQALERNRLVPPNAPVVGAAGQQPYMQPPQMYPQQPYQQQPYQQPYQQPQQSQQQQQQQQQQSQQQQPQQQQSQQQQRQPQVPPPYATQPPNGDTKI